MKQALIIISSINAAILFIAFSSVTILNHGPRKEGFLAAGLTAIALIVLNLLTGIIVRIAAGPNQRLKDYGHALLIVSSLLLLCSFTLCSQGL